MNKLTETERAYIAGFFDGEGCVNWRTDNRRARLIITQKDRAQLEAIHEMTGIGRLRAQPHSGKVGETYYRYEIGAQREVVQFVRAILPYAILKRPKLREVLRPWRRLSA